MFLNLILYSLSDYIISVKKAYSLTEAKARFSEIVDRLIKEKEIVMIRKNGENVAILVPYDKYLESSRFKKDGLILAAGALADYEDEIDEMMRIIMKAREKDSGREVDI